MAISEANTVKAHLTLRDLLDNAEEVLGYPHKQDRTIKIVKSSAMAGVKWVRFDGLAYGTEEYPLTMIFFDVKFNDEQTSKFRVPVVIESNTGKMTKYIELLKVNQNPIRIFCGCQWFRFACFPGDTLIPLADGNSVPIKSLVGKHKFYIFSYDVEKKKRVIGEGKNCKLIEKNAKILKINLDNGKFIRCTPDHKFLLIDGSYVEAQYLKSNDSLMAMYRKTSDCNDFISGYEMYYEDDSWKYTHHISDEFNMEHNLPSSIPIKDTNEKSWVRHHKDFNKRNNNPENIERVSNQIHHKLHNLSEESKENNSLRMKINNPMFNPESIRKMVDTNRKNGFYKRIGNKLTIYNKLEKTRKKFSDIRKNKIALGEIDIYKPLKAAYETNKKLIKEGKFHFQSDYHKNKMKEINLDKVSKGIHPFQTYDKTKQKRCVKILELEKWFNSLPNGTHNISEELVNKFNYSHFWSLKLSLERIIKRNNYPAFVTRHLGKGKGHCLIKGMINHKVVSIENDGYEDVYCFEVPEYSNFLIDVDGGIKDSSGIFVHNCEWYLAKAGALAPNRKARPYIRKTTTRPSPNPKRLPCLCKHGYQMALELRSRGVLINI